MQTLYNGSLLPYPVQQMNLDRISRRLCDYLHEPSTKPTVSRSWWIVAGLVLLVISTVVTFAFWEFGIDDAFIGYRIAQNVATGHGWVYNTGERVNGATSPLWASLLVVAAMLQVMRPFAHVAAGLCLVVAGLLVWRLTASFLGERLAFIASVLLVTHPLLLLTIGMETPLYLTLAALSLWAWRENRPWLLGLFLAGLTLGRPDGVLLAGILLTITWMIDRRVPWRSVILFLAPVLAWSLFSYAYFGSPFPNTLEAKMAQTRSGFVSLPMGPLSRLPLFTKGAIFWLRHLHGVPVLALVIPCMLAALASIRRWHPTLAIVVLWAVAHLAAYSLLRVPFNHWYYSPVLLAFVLVSAEGYRVIVAGARRLSPMLCLIAGALGLFVIYSQMLTTYRIGSNQPEPRTLAYTKVGLWLQSHAKAGDRVAAAEIGVIGYVSEQPIVDMAGLIHREGPAELRKKNFGWWLESYRPEFVITHSPVWPLEKAVETSQEYRIVKEFEEPFYGVMRIYRR